MLFLRKKYCLFVLFAFVISFTTFSQQAKESIIRTGEKGLYPLINYSTKTYRASPQNWAILQDKRGVLYVGNNEGGVLEYDGVAWRMIKVINETNVRSLAMDEKGKIYVGAYNEFGFLEPDAKGNMRYVSLLSYVEKNDRDFSDVWSAIAAKDGIYFQTENKIFRWDGKKIKVWNAEKSFHRIFYVNDHFFVRQREIGLMEIVNESLVPIKGGEAFSEESVYGMIPFGVTSTGKPSENILLCTRKKGLFIMKPSDKKIIEEGGAPFTLENFSTQIDPFLMENLSYHLLKTNSLYSIATVTKGTAVIDADGNLSTFMNKEMGLNDETVYSQFSDASGNLWLATNNGLSKLNINSPITYFSDRNGLGGTVQSITRHNGMLFAATSIGVYVLREGSITNGMSFSTATFEKLKSTNEECWDLLPFKSGNYSALLCVSNRNIFSIDNQFNTKEVINCRPWMIYRSITDSSRVFIGLENGVSSIYWDGSKWQEEATFHDIKESVRSIAEDKEGNLWLGHNTGVIKINFINNNKAARKSQDENAHKTVKYDTTYGLPHNTIEVENVNGTILYGSINGISIFKDGKFVHNPTLGAIFSDGSHQVHRMSYEKSTGWIWLETYRTDNRKFEFGYLKQESDQSYSWNPTPFLPYSDEIIFSVLHDMNGITWLGGTGGIYRYDSHIFSKDSLGFNTLIRKVTIGKDSTLFNGTFFDSSKVSSLSQNTSLIAVLPFANNSVIFEFAAADFQNENAHMYQYYLDGFDNDWSNWKHETKAVYTNLPEGNYTFHVKAKNIFGNESTEAKYEFTILPPWYRTWWAYVLYVLASIGFVYAVVTYVTRGLKTIIRERTAEIVKQKEEIEYKNRNITDSINYAKRIQEAILPPYEMMRSHFPESFILYKPKDIVAGDFYWFSEKDRKFMVAACDCTGHGVPGAFMSLIGYSLINEVILEKAITDPANALDAMKKGIIKSLGQKGQEGEQKDGMDMSLVSLEVLLDGNKVTHKLSYAGANNSLYIVRKGELIELNADKMPIGIYMGIERPFTNKEMLLEQGDTIYLFTDGYADQFGGDQGKKFTKKRFKDALLKLGSEPLSAQKHTLERTLTTWAGDQQQVDDVLVIGIRIA